MKKKFNCVTSIFFKCCIWILPRYLTLFVPNGRSGNGESRRGTVEHTRFSRWCILTFFPSLITCNKEKYCQCKRQKNTTVVIRQLSGTIVMFIAQRVLKVSDNIEHYCWNSELIRSFSRFLSFFNGIDSFQ
jgi:hypothetical protein